MTFDQLNNETTFFLDTLELFYETQWIYRFPVTEILIRNVLDLFPDGWMTALKSLDNDGLNEFVVNKVTKKNWPESLLSFVEKCRCLDRLLPVAGYADIRILPKSFRTGLSEKKQHEILCLANLVNTRCEKEGIKTIVDLGAGLGYVCQLLNHLYGYRVFGLESNRQNVETAKRRQRELYESSMDSVNYICTKIDVDSADEIAHLLKHSNVEEDFCLIGLHACGDLGVDATKLFAKIASARILILLSCCYHKIEMRIDKNSGEERFRNFPVSESLKNLVDSSDRNYREFLKRPFLRLACQEPASRWSGMSIDSHREHAFHVMARAHLELFAHKNSIKLKKRTRKATRKSQCADFLTYLQDFMLRYEFVDVNEKHDLTRIQAEILSGWHENHEKLEDTEIYTGLQIILQSSAESLVLSDRRCWLIETGFEAEIVPVTSRNVSPRSHAIVSKKK